jgi:hypothetical protein
MDKTPGSGRSLAIVAMLARVTNCYRTSNRLGSSRRASLTVSGSLSMSKPEENIGLI